MKTDVLVVGAGPVGLTMAAELARYGLSVRIVEKGAQRTDKSKALVIWSRTLELLDRTGCTPAFLATGFKATGANITSGDRQITHVSLDTVDSPHPYALMIPQAETERLLEEHLLSLGITVERNVELTDFTATEHGVTSTLRLSDGREERVESSWLTGCDGAHSTVRHKLGLEFEGNTLNSDWILADLHLSNVPNSGDINILWHSAGVLAIFPIGQDRYRIVADVGDATETRRADPTLEEVQAVLDQRGPGGITVSDPVWLAAFRINERKVTHYSEGRVFLAGDAAHIHSPAGGQGMNTGMQDAFNLSWKLALVSRGANSSLLDSYSLERSAVGDKVLKDAGRLTIVATLRGGVKQTIRNHMASLLFGFSSVRQGMADTMSELSIGYEHSPLSVQHGHFHDGPRAGQRAPIREGETPIGTGPNPRFTLCGANDETTALLVAQFPDLLEAEVLPPYAEGGLWLVRPDGYIAVATRTGDAGHVSTFLKSLAAR